MSEINRMQSDVLKTFRTLPGVGKAVAMDLWNLGYRDLETLRPISPDELYERISEFQQMEVDRCMLYVFRCIHYILKTSDPDPEKLKWWNWTDSKME